MCRNIFKRVDRKKLKLIRAIINKPEISLFRKKIFFWVSEYELEK